MTSRVHPAQLRFYLSDVFLHDGYLNVLVIDHVNQLVRRWMLTHPPEGTLTMEEAHNIPCNWITGFPELESGGCWTCVQLLPYPVYH